MPSLEGASAPLFFSTNLEEERSMSKKIDIISTLVLMGACHPYYDRHLVSLLGSSLSEVDYLAISEIMEGRMEHTIVNTALKCVTHYLDHPEEDLPDIVRELLVATTSYSWGNKDKVHDALKSLLYLMGEIEGN